MDHEILKKAEFLIRDCQQSEEVAVITLKRYYPELGVIERERYVAEAWDRVHCLGGGRRPDAPSGAPERAGSSRPRSGSGAPEARTA
ncbi:hypothetical protein [Kitasatospora mediocidica]|uniref:hypothetical protein n=1 Tax=Kitasatospora mediocidica TaxID=58352 RepID=UPI00056B4058|nr:hypothetical protein [Kitasatospora mediocidica]